MDCRVACRQLTLKVQLKQQWVRACEEEISGSVGPKPESVNVNSQLIPRTINCIILSNKTKYNSLIYKPFP